MADTSIYSRFMPREMSMQDYLDEADARDQRGMQNKLNTMMLQDKQRGYEEANQLRALYAQPDFDPSTPEAVRRVMRVSPTQGMVLQKGLLDADAQRSKIAKEKVETLDRSLNLFRTAVPTVQSMDDVAGYVTAMYKHPELGSFAQQFGTLEGLIASNQKLFATDPDKWKASAAGMSADKLIETLKGTRQNVNLGNVNQGSTVDYYGRTVPDSDTSSPIGQSADNAATNERSRSDAALNRAQSAAQFNVTQGNAGRGVTYQTGADGNIVALPTQPAPGQPITPRPVTGADGQPIPAQPSEAVRKELMGINQQRSILQGAIDAVAAAPTAFSVGRGLLGRLPLGETAAGRQETPEETQARAYVFNNVSRVINERAGAAQSAQELARLNTFLPADTDGAEQITNKLVGFQRYLDDMEKGTSSKPGNASNLRDAAAAELARRKKGN